MKREMPAACVVVLVTAATIGCNSADTLSSGAIPVMSPFTNDCTDQLDDVYKPPTVTTAFTDSQRGVVEACANDTTIDQGQSNDSVSANGYIGGRLSHAVTVFRIQYRTARMPASTDGPPDGFEAAFVFVPDKPVDPHVAVVTAHDTAGFSPVCAPSLSDQTFGRDDTHTLNLAFAAAGYVTIAPDFSNFGYDTTPQGWLLAQDEAHSVLDATRALASLQPADSSPDKIVLVGFGEGGHAVLAAQSMAESYGHAGKIVGVAALAPIWTAPRVWGAAIAPDSDLNTGEDPNRLALSLLYFYGHGELYDGTGGGVTMFQLAQQQPVRDLVGRYCIDDLEMHVTDLGHHPSELYESGFARSVGACAETGPTACKTAPASVWNPRFSADRPSSSATGAPIVVWQGALDTVVTPADAECGKDKLERDLGGHAGMLTYCGDDHASHGGTVERDVDWVRQWVAHVASGAKAPAACEAFAPVDDKGNPVTCPATPPNSD